MIVKFLEILTEYLSIVLCIHRVAEKRLKISWCSLFDFAIYLLLMIIAENTNLGKLILYMYWFLYMRIRVTDTWKKTIKPYCIMMCAIPMLQLLLYAAIGETLAKIFSIYFVIVIVNILIILFLIIWKEKYITLLINTVTKFGKIIVFILLIFLFRCLISYFSEYKVINAYSMRQMVICFLIVALMLIFWINSENEKRHKVEELRTYQLYTKTFEDAVATIRMNQHEFDNHINAIKCMRYTIHDTDQLIDEQDKYFERILQENKYNKLLKLNMSPILTGYLYSKFTAASAHGINIEYEIHDIAIEYIAINDLIEIIGILFDNAVEALEEQDNKQIEVKLLKVDDIFKISIANISGWKTNSEIEKFFQFGYSTKGKEHGIGLCRVNTLLKKYKTCIQVENITKNDMNYLCFKVSF